MTESKEQWVLKAMIERLNFDDDNALQRDLKAAVDEYFRSRNLSRHADWRMVAKTVFFLGSLVGLWVALMTLSLPAWAALGLCVLLGLVMTGIGFNVTHDAIHGAYSAKAWVNRTLSMCFDLIGASSYTWSRAHNFVHHTYTNVPDVDHDLDPGPMMHFWQRERPAPIFRFQHLYAPFFYALTSLSWVFKKDFVQALGPDYTTGKRAPTRELVKLFAGKLVHWTLFLVLPILYSGYAWWQVAVGYLVMHFTIGLTIALVFQLAHVVEATEFPEPDARKDLAYPWAEHQLRTTANFGIGDWLTTFYTGGLNHQVEHHLFMKVCHVHYPALSPIVREVARRHGVPYHENVSFLAALRSHFRVMKRFGRPRVTPMPVVAPEAASPVVPRAQPTA